jgi:hypothetical protein
MSWLSAFTGQDASKKAANATNDAITNAQSVAAQSKPLAANEASNILALQAAQARTLPSLTSGVNELGGLTTQDGRDNLVDAYGNQARAAAQAQAANAVHAFNLSPEIAKGFALGGMNDANDSTNAYAAQLNSPAGRMQALQSLFSGYGMLTPNPQGYQAYTGAGMNALGTAAQDATQAAAQQQQILSGVGSILGMFAGGLGGKAPTAMTPPIAPTGPGYTTPNLPGSFMFGSRS